MPKTGGDFMSAKPKDHRPKIISFPTVLDGLNIAARQSILWPCHAFSISIPQKKRRGLNIFEETVLKITEIESGDTEKIALLTCLEKELVTFIQNRLNQLGLLNDRYELSENGQELLNEWNNKSDENLEYSVATVFLDLLSGKLLPYIRTDQLSYKKILGIDDSGLITFLINSTNEKSRVTAKQIRPTKDSFWKTIPDSNHIIRAIREFKKKYKRRVLLNKDFDQYPPPVPIAEAVTVNDHPELVYLHCNVLIQKGNADLLVTDGCGFGFSENFANYLTSQEWKWVTDLKQKGVIDKISNSDGSNNQLSKPIFKYAEISKRIVRSKSSLGKIKSLVVDSTNYESDYRQEMENGVKNLYEALEWALRQVVMEYPVSDWEQVFSSSNFQDNRKLLLGFVKKIGFTLNEKNQYLLEVKPGAIRQIKNGKVELQPLLALAIAGASSRATHPIHRLAKNQPGFLNLALKLKRYRDPIKHGSTKKLNIDDKMFEQLIESTIPVIVSLVQGVANDLDKGMTATVIDDINQERLKAIIELEKSLGVALVSNLSGDIKEQLMRSELMLAQYTEEKTIEIITCYASVLQHSLSEAVSGRRIEFNVDSIRETAVQKIVQSGFYSEEYSVPMSIKTVIPQKIRSAAEGYSSTLGAHLLAVFLLGTENELIELQRNDPEFVEFISHLLHLRGHGNKRISDFSKEEIESVKNYSIRNNVFKVIKIITEVF